jgi:hypothetical protein
LVRIHNPVMKWRDRRGLAWFDRFSLDITLATRLLVRYPMLTLVATVDMAFGIATGVGSFEIRTQAVAPSISLDDGSRLVDSGHGTPRALPSRQCRMISPRGVRHSRSWTT